MSELRYRDTIPLSWRRLDVEPGPSELERLQRSNSRLLQLLPSLESPLEPEDGDGPLPRNLQILELRIQVLTDLLGEVLTCLQPLPPARSVWLSASTAGWNETEDAPAPGERGLLELYVCEVLPRPLRLPAVVASVEAVEEGREVIVGLRNMDEAVTGQIEKLIFRQHRRLVARERGRG